MGFLKGPSKAFLAAGLFFMIVSPAYARGIDFKEAGAAVWIFLVIGVIIVLLQLIPATILFFSFIGSGSAMLFGRKKETQQEVAAGKEPLSLQDYSAVTIKK